MTKPARKSKTLIFNIFIAVISAAFFAAEVGLSGIEGSVHAGVFLGLTIFIAAVNAGLRIVTSQGITFGENDENRG